tara:strand:+ start:63 stop:755 length:693 start_codon:yes stop_codon:yes gene_type:complete
MTTSGTYSYNPSIGEVVLYAFNLCQVRSTSIAQEHLNSARQAMNMMLSRWSNMGPDLWKVDTVTITLQAGVSTYSVPADTVMILDMYARTPSGTTNTDRIMMPVSRSEYASYPNKLQQGFPTVFWFDRLISPTVTVWPVPDGSGSPTTITYYRVTQVQDANLPGGETIDVPYRWLDAFANGLAYYLARIWQPQLVGQLKQEADEAYMIAANQDTENVSVFISPQIQGYFR